MAKRAAARPTRAAGMTQAARQEVEDLVLGKDPIGALLGADNDEQFAATAGAAVRSFLSGLAGFFTTAKALEREALIKLDLAKKLSLPKTAEEDEQLQRFCKLTSAEKRAVEEHWKITSTISQFHRRMTARRAKATDALEQANRIANDLHNAYVETERRRVAAEQERLRREAEERARQEREAELERMEAAALEREAASEDLSARERLFVDYITGPYSNPARAAQQAGYKNPEQAAAKLLGAKKITAAIQAQREAKAIRDQAAARKAAPIDVDVETVQPNILRASGAHDRSTHSAELLDEQALIRAILTGGQGIPTDLLRIDTTVLNQYARSLEARINLWPGVRYKKTTKVI